MVCPPPPRGPVPLDPAVQIHSHVTSHVGTCLDYQGKNVRSFLDRGVDRTCPIALHAANQGGGVLSRGFACGNKVVGFGVATMAISESTRLIPCKVTSLCSFKDTTGEGC